MPGKNPKRTYVIPKPPEKGSPLNPNNYPEFREGVAEGAKIIRKNKRRLASGSAAVGAGIGYIPQLRPLGWLLQAPDVAFDIYDFLKDPSVSNAVDIGMDAASSVKQVKNVQVDDYVRGIGGAYDASNAIFGKNPVELQEEAIERKRKKQTRRLDETSLPTNVERRQAASSGRDR